jgi:transcription initiation factor TFIID subunit 6
MSMQPQARQVLLDLVKEHISTTVRDAIVVQRHTKRARLHNGADVRYRLHASDINMALQLQGQERLYAVTLPELDDPQRSVNLADFLRQQDTMPAPPNEISAHVQWLAVDGNMTNASKSNQSAASTATPLPETTASATQLLQVHQLQSSLLSEELQLYFHRVTAAMEHPASQQQQDSVLQSVATDTGLQELVPFLVRYCQQELYRTMAQAPIRLAAALLSNPHLHLESHLHELLPALVTCIVAKQLPNRKIRPEAAHALFQACQQFGTEYINLKPRVLRALWQAVQQPSSDPKVWASQFGGIVAITLFGVRVIDALLLPTILDSWDDWEKCLLESASEDLIMVQQASLDALSTFLRKVTLEEKAARLSRPELEEILGDRLVALEGEENEYTMCVV